MDVEKLIAELSEHRKLMWTVDMKPGVPRCHAVPLDLIVEAADALAKLQAERDEAIAEIARRDAVAKASWGDQADEHTDAIRAAHPTRTKQYETWDRALAMVGKRHGKYELVDLVNWLLVRAEQGSPTTHGRRE